MDPSHRVAMLVLAHRGNVGRQDVATLPPQVLADNLVVRRREVRDIDHARINQDTLRSCVLNLSGKQSKRVRRTDN